MQLAILLLAIACSVYGASVPTVENPCTQDQLYSLRYYQPYSLSERQYIECTPWNGYIVRDCYANAKWSSWLYRCSDEALEKSLNMSAVPTVPVTFKQDVPIPDLPIVNLTTCLYYGNETCVNGGICNMYPTGGRCACLSNTTGEYCQTTDFVSIGIFGQLINASFSLDTYRQNRPLLDEFYAYANGSIDASVVQCNKTRERIAEYLALYPNGTVRFDMLVNYLIQDYMTLLYPWQFFLQEFSYQSEVAMGYINAIPGLLMSSKYSYDKFDDVWALYDDVLQRLVKYLPQYMPNIKHEAELFFQIYDGFFKQFVKSVNVSDIHVDGNVYGNASAVTVDMIKSKIRRDFNKTLDLSWDLFRALGRFDEEIGVRASSSIAQLNASYVQDLVSNFSISANVTDLLGALSEINAEIWDEMTFYGFWYVVSEYVPVDVLTAARNETSFFRNDSDISRIIRPSRPKGVFRMGSKSEQDGAPIFQALVDERDDQLIAQKLVANVSRPLKLVGDDEPEKLVGDKLNIAPLKLVAQKPEKLVGVNASRPLKLEAEQPEKLVGVNASRPLKLEAQEPEKLVSVNASRPLKLEAEQPEKLVGVNASRPLKFVSDDSVVPEKLTAPVNVSRPLKLEADQPEKLVANITRPLKIVSDESIVPEKLVNGSARFEKLVGAFNQSRPLKFVADQPEKLVGLKLNSTVPLKLEAGEEPEKLVSDDKQAFPLKLVSAFAPDAAKKVVSPPQKFVASAEPKPIGDRPLKL
jgi:hypothetical protein